MYVSRPHRVPRGHQQLFKSLVLLLLLCMFLLVPSVRAVSHLHELAGQPIIDFRAPGKCQGTCPSSTAEPGEFTCSAKAMGADLRVAGCELGFVLFSKEAKVSKLVVTQSALMRSSITRQMRAFCGQTACRRCCSYLPWSPC